MNNANELSIGTKTETMICGFICPVEIIGRNVEVVSAGDELVIYRVKYLGEKKCVDIGNNTYIFPGYETNTRPMNINRAAEWRSKGY